MWGGCCCDFDFVGVLYVVKFNVNVCICLFVLSVCVFVHACLCA